MYYRHTDWGFEWGAAKIKRICNDNKLGWIRIGLETIKSGPGNIIEIYVTKTGKVRISDKRGEWMPPSCNGESKTPRKVMNDRINALEVELQKCVTMLDTDYLMPDGSNANTWDSHKLLGDYDGKEKGNNL